MEEAVLIEFDRNIRRAGDGVLGAMEAIYQRNRIQAYAEEGKVALRKLHEAAVRNENMFAVLVAPK